MTDYQGVSKREVTMFVEAVAKITIPGLTSMLPFLNYLD